MTILTSTIELLADEAMSGIYGYDRPEEKLEATRRGPVAFQNEWEGYLEHSSDAGLRTIWHEVQQNPSALNVLRHVLFSVGVLELQMQNNNDGEAAIDNPTNEQALDAILGVDESWLQVTKKGGSYQDRPYAKPVQDLLGRLGDAGFQVASVDDGGAVIGNPTDEQALDAILGVDESWLQVTKKGNSNTIFLVLGNSYSEIVADYSYRGNEVSEELDSVLDSFSRDWEEPAMRP